MRLVLHVPHSSKHVPAHERHSFLLSDDALEQELLHMTDAYTDELFSLLHAPLCAIPSAVWSLTLNGLRMTLKK